MRFSILLEAPYDAASQLGNWDRADLEEKKPSCIPRGTFRNLDTMSFSTRAKQDAWREAEKTCWRPLYGRCRIRWHGLEWHDFRTARNFNWGPQLSPAQPRILFKSSRSRGKWAARENRLCAGNSGYYAIGDEPLQPRARARSHHIRGRLEFSRKHLQKQFGPKRSRSRAADSGV